MLTEITIWPCAFEATFENTTLLVMFELLFTLCVCPLIVKLTVFADEALLLEYNSRVVYTVEAAKPEMVRVLFEDEKDVYLKTSAGAMLPP